MNHLGNDNCTECEVPLSAAWVGGVVAFTIAVIGAYYTVNMVYTARSTLIECSKMCVDMMVAFMQNLGVMNQILVGGLELLFFQHVSRNWGMIVLKLRATNSKQDICARGCLLFLALLSPEVRTDSPGCKRQPICSQMYSK